VLKVGLTGGIGAGKSAVAARLTELGAVVIDADVLARDVVAPGSDGLAEVVAAFGETVLDATGALDRARMAALVFADPAARRRLEAIIHPRVRARTRELIEAAPADAIVVNDVPLLVETGLAPTFHLVVVVWAPETLRLERLVKRGLTPQDAQARITAQIDDQRRRAAADAVVDNSGDLTQLRDQVDRLWRERLLGYERNLRLRHPVTSQEPASLRDHDADWAAQYARLAARIGHALAAHDPRVDHIGATAVPGMAAVDVIDIMVTVPEVDHRVHAALEEAGFPRLAGSDDHAGADPGRLVQVYPRSADSPERRRAVLLRDWLTADPDAAAEYTTLRRRLVQQRVEQREYARAKAAWWAAALPRAEEWAGATGWRLTH